MIRRLGILLSLFALLLSSHAAERYSKAGPVSLDKEGRRWAQQTLRKMSLPEKVGQMLSVRYFMDFENFDSDAYKQFRDQLQKYHIGSVVITVHVDGATLLKSPPLEAAMMTNQLQRESKWPLLIAADFERGLAQRMVSVPQFPEAMAFGAAGNPAYVERFGAIVAEESRAVGIHWNFFPVADVNSNPSNPIINTRSFGEDPIAVGDMVAAFIRGARAHGMLTTAKHFPGHGDTATDSHLGVALVPSDAAHMAGVELPPFRKAIAAGVDSVMVAHVTVPALEPDPNKVATISPAVINGVLRKQLGFKNLVVTDALEMRGLTSLYPPGQGNPAGRAAVDSVKAGNDMLLLPTDLDGAFQGVINAVRRGEISVARIDESVLRILEAKASVGLHKARYVDLNKVPYLVSRQEDMQFAQQVTDDAVTLVRDNGQVLPLTRLQAPPTEGEIYRPQVKQDRQVVTIVISDSVRGGWGRGFENALKSRRADATVFYVDNNLAAVLTPEILQAVKEAGKVVVAIYVSPSAGKQVMVDGKLVNSVGLEQASGDVLRQVLDVAAAKTAVVAMGNPYVVLGAGGVQTYLCTYSSISGAELSAVKVLFGELQPRGKLPVTLPGIAPRGFSLERSGARKAQ
ncbi:MAG: glycoside hydrolase family 3 protein [Acidobacteriia bacterium]|nr:glycoside hydrolase family 3 protein [Terriglobia bacterium]